MEIIKLRKENQQEVVNMAVEVLKQGGLVVYPTETCYGLAVEATNQGAVDKLLKFKRRPMGKAISIAVENLEMAEKYVELNDEARNLYRNFLPGPMTVISKIKNAKLKMQNNNEIHDSRFMIQEGTPTLPPSARGRTRPNRGGAIAFGLASERGTLGIRIPDYALVIEMVRKLGKPITATSANIASLPNPYSLEQWQKQTAKKTQELVDLFIDAGELPHRPPSTVVDTTRDELTVLRQGSLSLGNDALEFVTKSENETRELARRMIEKYREKITTRGLVIGLQGELGTGKTRFAQGVAKALGIEEKVKSPTFTIIEEYEFSSQSLEVSSWKSKTNKFFHLDVWRLEDEKEILELGLEVMLRPGNVILIEWVEKVKNVVENSVEEKGVTLLWGTVERLGESGRRWRIIKN